MTTGAARADCVPQSSPCASIIMRVCRHILPTVAVMAALLPLTGGGTACADVLELKNGGRIHGEIEDTAEGQPYVVSTADGGRVTISRSEVARVVTQSEEQKEYDRLARAAADSVDAHWRLAQWCRDRKLLGEYRQQLARILELDPDHEPARRALGHQKQNGQWMSREEVMAARGLVWYDGKYVTPQHVELEERAKETRVTEADWNKRLDQWRRWLTGRRQDRSEEALREIRAIRAPEAAAAVVAWLRREEDPAVKHLLLEVAAQIDDPLAVDALVDLSLADPDDETRYQCLEYLVQSGRPGLAQAYFRALKSQDNVLVNRAAAALGQIGDRDAIGPLVNALLTKHKQVVSSGSPDQHSYLFTPSGGTAMNFGGSGAKVVTQAVENRSVLSALVKLSGNANFGFDQAQWRAWLAAQAKAHPIDVRRD